jgi:hypothetical protein
VRNLHLIGHCISSCVDKPSMGLGYSFALEMTSDGTA